MDMQLLARIIFLYYIVRLISYTPGSRCEVQQFNGSAFCYDMVLCIMAL